MKNIKKDSVSSEDLTNKINKKLKRFFTSAGLIMMLGLPVSLTGCGRDSVENIATQTTIDDNDITLDLLDYFGIQYQLVDDYNSKNGYKVYSIEHGKFDDSFPKCEFLDYITSEFPNGEINYIYNDDFVSNYTYEDAINKINSSDIDDEYKNLLISAVDSYREYGCNVDMLYENFCTSTLTTSKDNVNSSFNSYYKVLTLKNLKFIKEYQRGILSYYNDGLITIDEYKIFSKLNEYVVNHEIAHMQSMYDNEYESSAYRVFLITDKNDKIKSVNCLGDFMTEGYADYLSTEVCGLITSDVAGYPKEKLAYIALKNILDLPTDKFLSSSDVIKMLNDLGYETPYKLMLYFEKILESTKGKYYFDDNASYSNVLVAFIEECIDCKINQGVSTEDINLMLDRIFDDYRKHIMIYNDNGNEYTYTDPNITSTFSITDMQNELTNYVNSIAKKH